MAETILKDTSYLDVYHNSLSAINPVVKKLGELMDVYGDSKDQFELIQQVARNAGIAQNENNKFHDDIA